MDVFGRANGLGRAHLNLRYRGAFNAQSYS